MTNIAEIETIAGMLTLQGEFPAAWDITCNKLEKEDNLEIVRIRLHSETELPVPQFSLLWEIAQKEIHCRWTPASMFNRFIPPDWDSKTHSDLAASAPVMSFFSQTGENRMTVALSEAMRHVEISGGVCEERNTISCKAVLFSIPEAPMCDYELSLRVDMRQIFYADAIGAAAEWFASFEKYRPAETPPAAFEPLYSTWYSFHQNLSARELEEECIHAQKAGLGAVIVDDGWQTEDNNRGYAFCGDWEISRKRFPDMRKHVENIHRFNMKYLLWYSVPFAGFESRVYQRFAGKYLYEIPALKTAVFDPRFPEVREYLTGIYETAVKEWNIDGFKLDFIDQFHFEGVDPAVAEHYAGRDIKSLPEACDVLLSEIIKRLRCLKPDILIEFRQRYIGPAIRKYGNMFRAGDCPADILSNRLRTLDLRLTSGSTAVHSDMLEWHMEDTAENAALQILNVLFSVPQISVRIEELPQRHLEMLHFWLSFCKTHSGVLLHGKLKPFHPELNYPLVFAQNETETVIAVYDAGQIVYAEKDAGRNCFIINATGRDGIYIQSQEQNCTAEIFDTTGKKVSETVINAGVIHVNIPRSGLMIIDNKGRKFS